MKHLFFTIIIALAITSYSYSQATNNLISRFKNSKDHKSKMLPFKNYFSEKIRPGQNGFQKQNNTDNSDSLVMQEWVARYASNSSDFLVDMVIDNSGNVYVTGSDYNSIDGPMTITIKYNSAGDSVWVARYPPVSGPASIGVDNSGNVYVTGSTVGIGNNLDYFTVKYNSSGAQQWVQTYNGPANDEDYSLALKLDASGNIYVMGTSFDVGYDFVTIKYNSSGVVQWLGRYSAPDNFFNPYQGALEVDAANNAYVSNTISVTDTTTDFITIKYNSSGVQQWAEKFTGDAFDLATKNAVDNSGNVFVTGGSENSDFTLTRYATVKYNSSGVQQWARGYDYTYNGATDIKVDNLGNIYVTGDGSADDPADYSDYVTIKYNTMGDSLWVAKYGGIIHSGDAGSALALDGLGNVYVTGITSSLNDLYWEYGTIKYNSSGVQQWVQRYTGTGHGNNYARRISVDASFNVYVSGTSDGESTFQDFATIKYSQDFPSPVELSSFTSTLNKRDLVLSWTTASELNNSGFNIERSSINGQWSKIGSVQGKGTSTNQNNYSFVDRGLNTGKYIYRLKQIDFNGNFEYFNLSNEVAIGIPGKYNLSQNYPNPFNPSTKINYDLALDGQVSITLFDISGREAATIVNEVQTAGYYTVTFNGANLSSGVYFYKLQSGDFILTKKMTLIK